MKKFVLYQLVFISFAFNSFGMDNASAPEKHVEKTIVITEDDEFSTDEFSYEENDLARIGNIGYWAGYTDQGNIAEFDYDGNSVSNFRITVSVSNSNCSSTYTVTFGYAINVYNNSFTISSNSNNLKFTGTFTSETTISGTWSYSDFETCYLSAAGAWSAVTCPIGTSPIFRFWNNMGQSHFFTIDENEKKSIFENYIDAPADLHNIGQPKPFRYEGIAWCSYNTQQSGTQPVYRFYSSSGKKFFFTMDEYEKNSIIANYPEDIWKYEGIAWYAYTIEQPNSSPVYRFWSDVNIIHFFTISEYEKNSIIANYPEELWKYEGISYHAIPAGQ